MRGFGDDRAEPTVPQTFLETGEQRLFVTGLDMDHPIGSQPRLGDGRCEQIGARDDPEHFALGPRRNPGGEHGGGRPVDRAITAAGDLMQASKPQPASRKPPVNLRQAEWQDLADAASTALQMRDALMKVGDDRVCRAIGHESPVLLKGLCNAFGRCYVLYLFSFGK